MNVGLDLSLENNNILLNSNVVYIQQAVLAQVYKSTNGSLKTIPSLNVVQEVARKVLYDHQASQINTQIPETINRMNHQIISLISQQIIADSEMNRAIHDYNPWKSLERNYTTPLPIRPPKAASGYFMMNY